MKNSLSLMLISLLLVQKSESSCEEGKLESTCSHYCFKVLRPVLDHTKALQSQIESPEILIQKKLDEHAKKMEEKFEDLRKMIELSLLQQTKRKNLKQNDKLKNQSKSTDIKPFQKIGSKYYYIEQSKKLNWFEASNKCLTLDAHLASIKNLSELNGIAAKLIPYEGYWIDFNDLGTEGVFRSVVTGLQATYLNWHPGNPGINNHEHCGELWYNDKKHLMNDNDCNYKQYYICERAYQ